MSLEHTLQALIDAECAKAYTHGLVLRVSSGDGVIEFNGSAGAAKPNGRFPIASISKLFTATLILQLVDEGRITLDQTVQSILDDIDLSGLHVVKGVDHSPSLTVRHLMHQTSGLADYFESNLARDLKQGKDRSFGLTDVLQITRALPPQAAPDSGRPHYSDTNYQLLGAVIEANTGQTYNQALQNRICAPLGLTDTQVLQRADAGLTVYHKERPLVVPHMLASMGPDGGIISTPDEMLTFLRAHMRGHLFKPGTTAQMRQWKRLFFQSSTGAA